MYNHSFTNQSEYPHFYLSIFLYVKTMEVSISKNATRTAKSPRMLPFEICTVVQVQNTKQLRCTLAEGKGCICAYAGRAGSWPHASLARATRTTTSTQQVVWYNSDVDHICVVEPKSQTHFCGSIEIKGYCCSI